MQMNKVIGFILVFLVAVVNTTHAQSPTRVMVMEIKAEIDPRMSRYVNLALEHATKTEADIVVVEMHTYGGTLNDAKEIADRLLDFEKPVWVFIKTNALSAGALISIACDSIYMSAGASIGAATVVSGTGGEAAPDKYQSAMRSFMRSFAEANGRDPRIAEGMVDERIVIDSLKQAGKVITLTTSEALTAGYCERQVETVEEILQANSVERYDLDRFTLSLTERIIAFFLNPFISGLLILIIIGGIYFELQTPGIGFPLFAAVLALVLYLVPYYLNGLAEYWEILALFIGIVLIVLEIFVIPGFGVAGVLGIAFTISSLVLIMLNNDFFNFDFVPLGDIVVAMIAALGGITGGVFLLFVAGPKLTRSRAFQSIALNDTQEKDSGYTSMSFPPGIVGQKGTAYTILRPSGKIMVEGTLYDAYTRGEFIEKGNSVEVIAAEGTSLRVKKVE